MKYVQINFETNHMKGKVQNLPTRWTTPEGATINGFNSLPQSALYGLGWVPVTYEEVDAETHKFPLSPIYDSENKQFVFEAIPKDLGKLQAAACNAIDTAASAASARHISVGAGQEMRYLEKATQAAEFVCLYDSGASPDPAKYPFIKAEAEACNEDYITRARYIVATSDNWRIIGSTIEATRMGGKTAVSLAETGEEVISIREETLTTLEAI